MTDTRSTNNTDTPEPWADRNLRNTILFLAVPGFLFALILVFQIKIPTILLYATALILGLVLFIRSLSNPEWLMACVIIYMPLSKLIAIPVAPGINGPNLSILMLFISWFAVTKRHQEPFFSSGPLVKIVIIWAILSCGSAITAVFHTSLDFILSGYLLEYKAWLDQFAIFFAFVHLIRSPAMAKRLIIYMCLGFLLVVAMGVQEFFEKSGLGSIEKSRLLGPQVQPNDFGAFLVYNIAPFMAFFLHHVYKIRAWVISPILAVTLKLILATFSRGAYLGFALAGLAAGYVRGLGFLFFSGLLATSVLVAFPELIPNALKARMGSTQAQGAYTEELDKSSQTRLILWKASMDITLDYPILGVGFKVFTVKKDEYADEWTEESDNHNMYLYISSQMGIPALIVFLYLFFRVFRMGESMYRGSADTSIRVIGLGACCMVAGVAGVNMFGSRMIGIDTNGYFWVYLAILSKLWTEHEIALKASQKSQHIFKTE